MDDRKPVLWGPPQSESLTCHDRDEAIEAILDERDPLPETILIAGYARDELTEERMSRWSPLEYLLESLDEDFGDPDEATEPTQAMKDAEKVFLEAIRKEYVPWTCEEVCREEVVVADWIRENRPEWLEERKDGEAGG